MRSWGLLGPVLARFGFVAALAAILEPGTTEGARPV